MNERTRGRPTDSRRTNLLFSGLVFVALFTTGEVLVRTLGPKLDSGRYHRVLPGSPRKVGLIPGGVGTVGGEPLFINSFGMRDREYAIEKPPDTFRIAVLGDSYTFGVGVRVSETFCKVLERNLNGVGPPHYEVMNFGDVAYNTLQELATLRECAAPFSPDAIILVYYLNDTDAPEAGAAMEPTAEITGASELLIDVRDFLKKRSRLMAWLMHHGMILLRSVVPMEHVGRFDFNQEFAEDSAGWRRSREALGEMKTVADSLGAPLVLVLVPFMVNLNERYPFGSADRTILSYCAENEIPACDLLDTFFGMEGRRLWVSYLDHHFNERAHRLVASRIETLMRENGCCPY